jgi:hypothetical protein
MPYRSMRYASSTKHSCFCLAFFDFSPYNNIFFKSQLNHPIHMGKTKWITNWAGGKSHGRILNGHPNRTQMGPKTVASIQDKIIFDLDKISLITILTFQINQGIDSKSSLNKRMKLIKTVKFKIIQGWYSINIPPKGRQRFSRKDKSCKRHGKCHDCFVERSRFCLQAASKQIR